MNNLPEVEAAWKAMQERIDIAIGNASTEIGLRLKADAMKLMNQKRSNHPGKATTGDPPMVVTGTLRNSVNRSSYSARVGFGIYEAVLGADTVYARALELGGEYAPRTWQNGERFPYIQPTVEGFAQKGLVSRIIRKHLGAMNA